MQQVFGLLEQSSYQEANNDFKASFGSRGWDPGPFPGNSHPAVDLPRFFCRTIWSRGGTGELIRFLVNSLGGKNASPLVDGVPRLLHIVS